MATTRIPGPVGIALTLDTLDDGTTTRALSPIPGSAGTHGAPMASKGRSSSRLLQTLQQAANGVDLQRIVVALLGPQCFSAGVVAGVGVDLLSSVGELLHLMKTFALADLHDLSREKTSAWALADPRFLLAKLAGTAFEEQLHLAAEERDNLVKELAEAFRDQKALLANLTDAVANGLKKDWQDFNTYMNAGTLEGRFRAGMIFGKLLLVVVGLVGGGLAVARTATNLARRLPRLVGFTQKLGPRATNLERLRSGGGAVPGSASEAAPKAAPKKQAVRRSPPPEPAREPAPPPTQPWRAPPPQSGAKYADQSFDMTEYGKNWDRKYTVKIFNASELESSRVVPRPDGKLVFAETGELVNVSGKEGIYVMDQSGNLYVTEQDISRIHHSSLAAGGRPVAAGHVAIEDGQLLQITEQTGHFGENQLSGTSNLVKREMASQGANISSAKAIPFSK